MMLSLFVGSLHDSSQFLRYPFTLILYNHIHAEVKTRFNRFSCPKKYSAFPFVLSIAVYNNDDA